MKKLLILIFLAVLAGKTTTRAQQPAIITSDKTGWHKIGETTANFKTDRDEVLVLGSDRFSAIRFKITDAPIHLLHANIDYESGEGEEVRLDFPVQASGESKTVKIKGGERAIKKIVFVYRTVANRSDEKAHVEIWGLKTNTDKKDKSGKSK